MIGRLIRLILGAFVVSTVGAAIAALVVKQRTPSVGTPESDEVALVAIFEPIEFASTASAFRGGSVTTWFGGGDIDLRDATLDPAGADLEFRVIFGGGRLIVPDEWDVVLHVTSIFGGVGDVRESRVRPADAPRLNVRGTMIFGGIGVDSSKAEAAIDVDQLIDDARSAAERHTNGAPADLADAATDLIPALDV